MLVGDIARKNARLFPNGLAVGFKEHRLTWRELNERANRLGNCLLQLGLAPGDRVVLFSRNSHHFFEFWFALAKAGLIGVTPNYRFVEKEVSYIINDSEATAVIVPDESAGLIQKILPESPKVKFLIGIGSGNSLPCNYEEMVSNGEVAEPKVDVKEDDRLLLLYTSGTTGNPKGAVWTHRSLITPPVGTVVAARLGCDDVNLNVLPLCLGGGVTTCFAFFLVGAPTIILEEFNPKMVLEMIAREKVTATTLVPTMIINLINYPEINRYDLSNLKKILYGSAAISEEILKQALQVFRCDFVQCYGATEASGFSGFLLPEDHIVDGPESARRRLSSCGRDAILAEQRVLDKTGREVKGNEVGEIAIKGAGVIKEYWRDPVKTREAIKDGWWHSGDLAKVDEEGYIYIVDRKSDMIISGAINIYPREIENVLYTHPSVKQAVVIGVPDKDWGEAVKAVIQLKEGMMATEQEIIDFCKQDLASYKKPKSVDFVSEFPLSTAGKILKRVVRDKYWKGKERRV